MATYQFLTYVIPRKPVLGKYDGLPKNLEIKHAEWEKYWDSLNIASNHMPEPNFDDAITTKWWKGIEIDIIELRKEIDQIIPRSSWNNESWKIENENVDHDLSIDYNEKENYIEDFRFRTDLRDPTLTFIKATLNICKKNDWILMDDKGNLCEPSIESWVKLAKESNAHHFLSDPDDFYNNLK